MSQQAEVLRTANTSGIGAWPHSILNIASVMGCWGAPELAVYTATKGAIIQLTKSSACDLAKHKIRFVCIPDAWRHVLTALTMIKLIVFYVYFALNGNHTVKRYNLKLVNTTLASALLRPLLAPAFLRAPYFCTSCEIKSIPTLIQPLLYAS